jgi:hypothetical protein
MIIFGLGLGVGDGYGWQVVTHQALRGLAPIELLVRLLCLFLILPHPLFQSSLTHSGACRQVSFDAIDDSHEGGNVLEVAFYDPNEIWEELGWHILEEVAQICDFYLHLAFDVWRNSILEGLGLGEIESQMLEFVRPPLLKPRLLKFCCGWQLIWGAKIFLSRDGDAKVALKD